MLDNEQAETKSHSLRAALKEWERTFSEEHKGRKPGKEDIKNAPDIAAKYKSYRNARKGLKSRKNAPATTPPREAAPRSKSVSERTLHENTASVSSRAIYTTPQKTRILGFGSGSDLHSEYDLASTSRSPHPAIFRNAIGPTPQRDGKILGLFDGLSSTTSSMLSSRKRKAARFNILSDDRDPLQTPSKRLATGVAEFDTSSGQGRRLSRTPTSDGKKFMLNQFFATPNTLGFAAIFNEHHSVSKETTCLLNSLQDKVPSTSNSSGAERNCMNETTPNFLKRRKSFTEEISDKCSSTPQVSTFTGKRPTNSASIFLRKPSLRPLQGKPLSEIVRNLRAMNEVEDEKEDTDAIDILREMELKENDALAEEQKLGAEPDPKCNDSTKAWKKKGQKRSTRKIAMKPAATRRLKGQVQANHAEDHLDRVQVCEEVDQLAETQPTRQIKECSQIIERDLQDECSTKLLGSSKSQAEKSDFIAESDPCGGKNGDIQADSTSDVKAPPCPLTTTRKKKIPASQKQCATFTKLGKGEVGKKEEQGMAKSKGQKGTNPNAVVHMNFRSLKIRNKSSKSKSNRTNKRFGKHERRRK